MDNRDGSLLFAVVVIIVVLEWTGVFRWFGRLPGDINIEQHNGEVHLPISSILVTLGAGALVILLGRLL